MPRRALEFLKFNPAIWRVNVQLLLKPHEKIVALNLSQGCHLSHGYRTGMNKPSGVSMFLEIMPYKLDESTGYIDYKQLEKGATLFRPKLIVTNASAYACVYDYARSRKVYNKQEVILLADVAHISGLVDSGVIYSSFEYATSFFALEDFGNEQPFFHVVSRLAVVARSILEHIRFFGNIPQFVSATIGGERATKIILVSNLEDKVLIEDGNIVMNQLQPNVKQPKDGLRRRNRIGRPSQRLIWDPDPINNRLKGLRLRRTIYVKYDYA
ncbi:hypothetical protein RND71_000749 [Anisodus tanguticus]|uniref:Serine hydroxymethyltransferase-like domain-containing protein n=1 Tax=Anisodus tanguticus TaxID=243964 RepID=A0AAE1T119_9SOLA|nr:hypothetical protein RND71_000749 [Anisodus tanguticus]